MNQEPYWRVFARVVTVGLVMTASAVLTNGVMSLLGLPVRFDWKTAFVIALIIAGQYERQWRNTR